MASRSTGCGEGASGAGRNLVGLRSGGSVLALLIALAVITFLDRISIAVAGARIQDELHIAPERWGWILGAFVLAYGLFEIPSGALGDRSGYKRVLSRIVLWWSAFTCLTGLATGFTTLLATRFLFGAGEAGAYPNIAGVIAQWFPKEQRASKQGFIWSASRLGGALSPLIVVPLQQRLGWRVTFAILGAVGVIWVVCWKLMYSEVQRLAPKVTEPIPWRVLSSARMRLIIAMYFCQAFGSWFYFAWFPVYLVKGAGFSESQMGIFSALPFVLGATGSLIGGVLSDRFGRSANRFGRSCRIVPAASQHDPGDQSSGHRGALVTRLRRGRSDAARRLGHLHGCQRPTRRRRYGSDEHCRAIRRLRMHGSLRIRGARHRQLSSASLDCGGPGDGERAALYAT